MLTHQRNTNENLRLHIPPGRRGTIKKIKENKYWQRCEKKFFYSVGVSVNLVPPLWKTVWKSLKKAKIELPYGLTIRRLGIYPKEMKSVCRRNI